MKKFLKWILIAVVLGGGGYGYYSVKFGKKNAEVPTYERTKVERRDVRTTVESTGEVQPRNRLDVKPPIAGRLEELLVEEGDDVVKGQILGWISSTERATLLDAALATSKDELHYWQELYKPSPLVSPLNGAIIARNFEPGQSIGNNDVVVVIADDLIVVASLDETDIGQVKLGQRVEVRLESYPDTSFSGVVEKISYDAKTVSNVTMYEVDVRPDALPEFARSGMTANLEFILEEQKNALAVPTAAVQQRARDKASQGSAEQPEPQVQQEKGDRPDPEAIKQRMRERGLSEEQINERLARFSGNGGARKSASRGGRSGDFIHYVLIDSDDPDEPIERKVKTGISDGSYIEIIEGLEEGDAVLIQKIRIGSGRSSGSPFSSRRR